MEKDFLPQIPNGFKVFIKSWDDDGFDGITIAGLLVPENKYLAQRFARGKDQYISLIRELDNKYDKNAVAVVAHWKGWLFNNSRHIGYIPRKIAKEIAKNPPFSNFKAGLKSIYVSADNYINIRIDLWCRENIVSLDEKEAMKEVKKTQELESLKPIERKKKELFNYLLENLNACPEDYDCNKISKRVLKEIFPRFLNKALEELGKSETDLATLENGDLGTAIEDKLSGYKIEIFVEILRLHPDLKKKSEIRVN